MAPVSLANSVKEVCGKMRQNPVQLSLAILLVVFCGATKKFQLFPMPWIAGNSECRKIVTEVPGAKFNGSPYTDGKFYTPKTFEEFDPNCKEKAEVFVFVGESFTITTAYLIFFGITKAIFNFVTGACCDRFGRKWTLVAGWVVAIPLPLMVIFAESWWTAALSNIFLGMQQALVWSATIFIMIDYFGKSHAGTAVGINETVGYTTISVVGVIAAAIMDENEPRTTCYYIVIGMIVLGIVLGVAALKESKDAAVKEEAEVSGKADSADEATLSWPSGRTVTFSKAQSAFVYTSFINVPLMSINFAGLMANFISGFAWGLFAKWMKNDYEVDGTLQWSKLSKETIANITLCYGLPKGLFQWIFGFAGDRFGRRWIITAGLAMCAIGLVILAAAGEAASDPVGGFAAGALFLGVGTAMMYSNNIAAVSDHADPTWRSSALGTYRFWRDLGYAVGALINGAFADAVGIFGSVLLTAALTALAAICVGVFYREGEEVAAKGSKEEAKADAAL
mmetsp:Transcript_126431/g.366024  ORF Transcript_126431/g.366024 Transcript_126431/m.366024 type:complete len:508 (-) Transcript_126431:361-1884(-)